MRSRTYKVLDQCQTSLMPDPAARLLALLSLLQTPREWPSSELAQRLGVTDRTVRRDVERLRGLGYPVEASMGVYGGYRLAAGAAMPPLLLEDDEAVTLAIGLRLTAGQPVAGLEESAVRALTKVLQVMPPRLRHRAKTVAAATVSAAPLDSVIDPETLTALASTAANRERVRFGYADWQGRTTTRHVEPVKLVALSRRWYLVAFDLDRTDWRAFRVDRIAEPRATGGRAAHRELPGGDVHTYLAEARAAMAPVLRGDIILDLSLADAETRLRESLGDGCIEAWGHDHTRWRTHADTVPWLASQILHMGCEFEVRGPPELSKYLRELADRIVRAGSK
jgi:predicted DNA-binding transcriptional regulator YafY